MVDEDVPKSPAEPEELEDLPDDDVPLASKEDDVTPDDSVTTLIEQKTPLSATVPETGDTMDPMIPLAGMGLSLIAIVGVVVIRKKKLIK